MKAGSIYSENIYQWMERTGFVDQVLFWAAILVPLGIAVAYRVLRDRPAVQAWRRQLVMACVIAPVLFVLWKVYNAVADHFGLDSVLGTAVNAGIFLAVAGLLAVLNLILMVRLDEAVAAPTGEAPPAVELAPVEPQPAAAPEAPPAGPVAGDQPVGSDSRREARVRVRIRESGKSGETDE